MIAPGVVDPNYHRNLQDLKVSLRPRHGVDVEDRLRVRVKGSHGFAARLNHRANILRSASRSR
jgi:hypothetical protein